VILASAVIVLYNYNCAFIFNVLSFIVRDSDAPVKINPAQLQLFGGKRVLVTCQWWHIHVL